MRSGGRSLWPREHGAYAQLGVPLATALVVRAPTSAAILFAISACSAFLAHEPLLVVLGHRGPRMRAIDGRRAAWRLGVLASSAALTAATALWLAPREATTIASIAAGFGVVMVALAWRRAEHSLAGELLAALVLPGASAPVAVASGVSSETALALWAAWAIGYGCSVVTVHLIIARHRRRAWSVGHALPAVLAALTLTIAVLCVWIPIAVVAVPLCAIATGVAMRPPRATQLRALGIALVIVSAASGSIALVLA